jgi:hypothetical protein
MKVRKPPLALLLAGCLSAGAQTPQSPDVVQLDRARVPSAAEADLAEQPLAITAFPAPHAAPPRIPGPVGQPPGRLAGEEVVRNFFIRQPVLWEPVGNNKPSS